VLGISFVTLTRNLANLWCCLVALRAKVAETVAAAILAECLAAIAALVNNMPLRLIAARWALRIGSHKSPQWLLTNRALCALVPLPSTRPLAI
jgi:hypothetical protein